ncbi:hypothetical protein AAC387_Pa03g1263 [Persea americana]
MKEEGDSDCRYCKFLEKFIRANQHRSNELFTELQSLELTTYFAQAFLFWSSPLERTQPRSSEPLIEPWSLEPPSFFTRPFLTWSSPLKHTQPRLSKPLTKLWSLEPPSFFARASLLLRSSPPDLNQSARVNSLSARANCTEFLGFFYCFQIWYFKDWMGCFDALPPWKDLGA